jgi:hypothetical protein
MDNIPGWKVFSAGLGIAALAVAGYLVWHFGFRAPDDIKKELQEKAVVDALNQLAAKYEEKVRLEGEQNVVVMPVRGDTSGGQIRHMIVSRMNSVDGVNASEPKSMDLDERATRVLKSVFEKDSEDEGRDPATVFEKSAEVDEVLAVNVFKLSSTADNGICVLHVVRIVQANTPQREAKVLDMEQITGRSGVGVETTVEVDTGPGFWSVLGGFLWRMLVVLAVAAVLPFASWPLAKIAFRQDSNALNAGLLIGLTALDVFVLFLLVSFQFTTTAVISAGLLLPAALIYNFRMLGFIEEQ